MKIGKVVTLMSKMCLLLLLWKKKNPKSGQVINFWKEEKKSVFIYSAEPWQVILLKGLFAPNLLHQLLLLDAAQASHTQVPSLDQGCFPSLGAERTFPAAAAVPGCSGLLSRQEPGGVLPVLPMPLSRDEAQPAASAEQE